MNTEQKWLPMLSRAAAAGLAGLGLTLLLSWLAALAMNHDVLPGADTRLACMGVLRACVLCCRRVLAAAGAGEGTWRSHDVGSVGNRISHSESSRRGAGFLRRYRCYAADRAGCRGRRFVHFS